jgi:hypothetical protein
LFFDDLFVSHINNPKIVFLNPFDILDNSIKHFDYLQNTIDEIAQHEEDDEFSNLTTSLMELTKSIANPIFEFAKSQMNQENINASKKHVLNYVTEEIIKHTNLLSQANIEDEIQRSRIKSIIEKYEFLKSLIEWTKKENSDFSICKIA